jgi:hypothetical protein
MQRAWIRRSLTTHSKLEVGCRRQQLIDLAFLSRWMAPMLAHTLPLNHVFPIWDALFSRPERTRDTNPKIEHLVDICTSMLMRARAPLFA